MKVSAGYITLLASLTVAASGMAATGESENAPQQLRQLQKKIESFGGDPPAGRFPLKECQGDCDTDDHCAYGLVCFQKGPNRNVPGCQGVDTSRTDFCIKDPNPGSSSSGNNGASVLSIDVVSAEESESLTMENDVSSPGDEDVAAAETEQKSAATTMLVPGVVTTVSIAAAVIGLF